MNWPRWLRAFAAHIANVAPPADPTKPDVSPNGETAHRLDAMTDADLERELHRAIFTLNLWTRAALARGLCVNVAVTTERDALHPAGRPVVHAEIVRRVVGI